MFSGYLVVPKRQLHSKSCTVIRETDPSSLRMQTDSKDIQSEQQASLSIIKLFNATEKAPSANTMRSKIC